MAVYFGISKRTLEYRLKENGLNQHTKFSAIADDQLHAIVQQTMQTLPNSGKE